MLPLFAEILLVIVGLIALLRRRRLRSLLSSCPGIRYGTTVPISTSVRYHRAPFLANFRIGEAIFYCLLPFCPQPIMSIASDVPFKVRQQEENKKGAQRREKGIVGMRDLGNQKVSFRKMPGDQSGFREWMRSQRSQNQKYKRGGGIFHDKGKCSKGLGLYGSNVK